ncbi:MAG: AAA family ATPase [Eubacterium sp.]|nr:AAA family ATPase [Eubacterium sp.]
MGIYLNPGNSGFAAVRKSEYIDKSGLIALINNTIGTAYKLTCVSRPRRFGKSFAAKMLCAYYDGSCDSAALFDDLAIATDADLAVHYREHLNQYHIVYLDMTGILTACNAEDLPAFITECVGQELRDEMPDLQKNPALYAMMAAFAEKTGRQFIMIIDEWDAPVREHPEMEQDYLRFLRSLFKNSGVTDKIFAAVYMTGILPIKKDGSQSAISDFREYTMVKPRMYAPFVGFSEEEVRLICEQYGVGFSEMKSWYDGYGFTEAPSVYNPNSVMEAARNKEFASYWTETSAASSLLSFISMDQDGLAKTITELIGGIPVHVDSLGFANDLRTFRNRDDVLTLLIHLGYLAYDEVEETARIPNEEIRLEFSRAVREVKNSETIQRVRESDQLILDTVNGNADAVAAQIEKIHREETSPLFYNNEQALRSVIKLAYFSYKDYFIKFEELPSGRGYADLIYFPKKRTGMPALLIELKWEQNVKSAIDQIRQKQYPTVLSEYGGEILLVEITYESRSGKHSCVIEPMT